MKIHDLFSNVCVHLQAPQVVYLDKNVGPSQLSKSKRLEYLVWGARRYRRSCVLFGAAWRAQLTKGTGLYLDALHYAILPGTG